MADEEVTEAAGGGGKSKLIIIILIVVILLLAGAAGFLYMQQQSAPPHADSATAEEGAAPAAGEDGVAQTVGLGETVDLTPFVINLSSATGADRYLKVAMVLQVSNVAVKEEIVSRDPQIKDSIITVLSSKSPEEVLTIQGKYDLKLELVKRINGVVTTGVVREMFFTEFVIQ